MLKQPASLYPRPGLLLWRSATAKLVKIFESDGVLTEEIRAIYRKQIELNITNRP